MSEHPLFCARLCLEGIDDKCNEKRRTSERETQREQRGYNIAVLPTKPYVWMHWGLFVHHFTSASFSHYKGGIKKNWHFLYFFTVALLYFWQCIHSASSLSSLVPFPSVCDLLPPSSCPYVRDLSRWWCADRNAEHILSGELVGMGVVEAQCAIPL